MKRFNLTKPGTNEVVMGPMDLSNAYLKAYPSITRGHKLPADLEIGEHSEATYSLSGTKGTYWIVRVE